MSLSARRAWIEIDAIAVQAVNSSVVALRKESVDRNNYVSLELPFDRVALRKESVDRNTLLRALVAFVLASLSARRAWIEISLRFAIGSNSNGRSPQGERG